MLPSKRLHQVSTALRAGLFLQGRERTIHVAGQLFHRGATVLLGPFVDEVSDHRLPAAVLVIHGPGDGGCCTILRLLQLLGLG